MSGPSLWKKQVLHPECRWIECPPYEPVRDWRPDPSGVYALIRTDADRGRIELALCDKEHRIFRVFGGKKCQDVYAEVFIEEKRSGASWFQSPEHIAYLGKELKKAELSLERGTSYLQE